MIYYYNKYVYSWGLNTRDGSGIKQTKGVTTWALQIVVKKVLPTQVPLCLCAPVCGQTAVKAFRGFRGDKIIMNEWMKTDDQQGAETTLDKWGSRSPTGSLATTPHVTSHATPRSRRTWHCVCVCVCIKSKSDRFQVIRNTKPNSHTCGGNQT